VTDVTQITAIYDHYVKNSIQVADLKLTTIGDWALLFAKDLPRGRLAFLVAVLKSSDAIGGDNNTGRIGKRADRNSVFCPQDAVESFSETIVVFTFSEFISKRKLMYRHATELHLFVYPNNTRQGVGRTLRDRIMPSFDMAYQSEAVPDETTIRFETRNIPPG
jgi:L-amino acid N-acyltransferase YncA